MVGRRLCTRVCGRPPPMDGRQPLLEPDAITAEPLPPRVNFAEEPPARTAEHHTHKILRKQKTLSIASGGPESLEWANTVVELLWPHVNKAAQKIVHDTVTPAIQAAVPSMIKGVHFETFTLGDKTPELGPIKVYERLSGGVQMVLGIKYHSDVDIKIAAGIAKVGINSISLEGDIHICLEHLIDEVPIVSGVLVYFLNKPRLDFKLEGIGRIADIPGFAGIVRNTVQQVFADTLVLPNCFPIPLVDAGQGVDLALLQQPKPVGVLRVHAVKAHDLMAADVSLWGAATSDPYVSITLANETWKSSTVTANLNPVWPEDDFHDFMVYNREQLLSIDVYDEDFGKSDDHIGRGNSIKVGFALQNSELPLTLVNPNDASSTCGSLELKFEWMALSSELSADVCIVAVKVGTVFLPHMLGHDVMVTADLCGRSKKTPVVVHPGKAAVLTAVSQAIQGVVKRCDQQKMDHATIALVAGIAECDVPLILSNETADTGHDWCRTTMLTLNVSSTLYIRCSREKLATESLELALCNAKGQPYSKQSVVMSSVLDKSCLTSGPSLKFSHELGEVAAEIEVSILGLREEEEMSIPECGLHDRRYTKH